jgi:two-component system nitrogen regulation response regulator NtrX
MEEARSCFERDYLMRKLEENGWNVSLTAVSVGLERTHLHRKMKTLGIKKNGA